MPIPYGCPHCGKHYTVADQYAGQTGPCAACGRTITIPRLAGFTPPVSAPAATHSPYAPYAQPQSQGLGGCAIAAIVLAVLGLVVAPVLLALLLPAVQAAREAARRTQSMNNLRQIGLAMHNYNDAYGRLPPAVVTDASGAPLYSGRVLLLPFLEQEGLYNAFDKTQAWNSPANLAITQQNLKVFRDPSAPLAIAGQTDYLFVTGTGTALDPAQTTMSFAKILDGLSNTLYVVEVRGSGVNWAEPRDLDLSQPQTLPPGSHPRMNLGLFYDGHVSVIPEGTPPGTIREMATRSGGEPPPQF